MVQLDAICKINCQILMFLQFNFKPLYIKQERSFFVSKLSLAIAYLGVIQFFSMYLGNIQNLRLILIEAGKCDKCNITMFKNL